MSGHNDGGPAFPIPLNEGQSYQGHSPCDGMTLRDYFAAKAMQGVLSNSDNGGGSIEPMVTFLANPERDGCEWVARVAYRIADAMLAARGAA